MISVGDLLTIGRWLRDEKGQDVDRQRKLIESIAAACSELVEVSDPTSDRATLLHEQLKTLYRETSQSVDAVGGSARAEKLLEALAWARILYWVKQYDGNASKGELPLLVEDQIRRGVSPSLDHVVAAAQGGDPSRLAALRRQAIRAIAELASLSAGIR